MTTQTATVLKVEFTETPKSFAGKQLKKERRSLLDARRNPRRILEYFNSN